MAIMMATMVASLKASAIGAAVSGAATATAGAGIGLGTLSTAATVVGGLASIFSGVQERKAFEAEAAQEEVRATQDEIQGKNDALTALRSLNRDQAAIAVAGFSSGIGSEGSVAAAQDAAQKVGDQNIQLSRDGARFQSSSRRAQAGQLRDQGRGAVIAGIGKGVSAGFSLFQRRTARG